jgi:hypothetical protein
MAGDQFDQQKRQLDKESDIQQAEQAERLEGENEEQQEWQKGIAAALAKGATAEKKSGTEKKIKRKIIGGILGGTCSCCLPLIFALILSLGILATIIVVAKNIIDASSNATDTLQPLM